MPQTAGRTRLGELTKPSVTIPMTVMLMILIFFVFEWFRGCGAGAAPQEPKNTPSGRTSPLPAPSVIPEKPREEGKEAPISVSMEIKLLRSNNTSSPRVLRVCVFWNDVLSPFLFFHHQPFREQQLILPAASADAEPSWVDEAFPSRPRGSTYRVFITLRKEIGAR